MAEDSESEQGRPAKGRKGSGLTEAKGVRGKQGRLAERGKKLSKERRKAWPYMES